jgi:hypothetical protein
MGVVVVITWMEVVLFAALEPPVALAGPALALLPGRVRRAIQSRWREPRIGRAAEDTRMFLSSESPSLLAYEQCGVVRGEVGVPRLTNDRITLDRRLHPYQ